MNPRTACAPKEARWQTAQMLARSMGMTGRFENLGPDAFGRPRAMVGGRPLALSFSHRGSLTAIACAPCGRIGVDLVDVSEIPIPDDGMDLVPLDERPGWMNIPAAARPRLALLAWACREALLKALGLGLRLTPEAIRLEPLMESSLEPSAASFRVKDLPGGQEAVSAWHLDVRAIPEQAPGLWMALAWAE